MPHWVLNTVAVYPVGREWQLAWPGALGLRLCMSCNIHQLHDHLQCPRCPFLTPLQCTLVGSLGALGHLLCISSMSASSHVSMMAPEQVLDLGVCPITARWQHAGYSAPHDNCTCSVPSGNKLAACWARCIWPSSLYVLQYHQCVILCSVQHLAHQVMHQRMTRAFAMYPVVEVAMRLARCIGPFPM